MRTGASSARRRSCLVEPAASWRGHGGADTLFSESKRYRGKPAADVDVEHVRCPLGSKEMIRARTLDAPLF